MQIIREPEQRSFTISDEYDATEQGDGYDFRERMIINNHIDGLLDFKINILGNEKNYEFDITELESLKFRCTKEKMNTELLSEILLDLFRTIFKGKEFMLLEEDFVLDPELIFIDRSGKPYLAYYSGYGRSLREQLSLLTDFLMNNVDYHDENAVLMVYTIYMKCREEAFSLEEIIAYTREKSKGGPVKKASGPPQIRKLNMSEIRAQEQKRESQQRISDSQTEKGKTAEKEKTFEKTKTETELKEFKPEKKKNTKAAEIAGESFRASTSVQRLKALAAAVVPLGVALAASVSGLTLKNDGSRDLLKIAAFILMGLGVAVLLERKIWQPLMDRVSRLPQNSGEISASDEATVLLFDRQESSQEIGCSFVSDIYPSINMNHFPFFIGKDSSRMDFSPEAPGISRFHLKVDKVGLEYTVLDLNSTNGSYLNDEKMAPNVSYKIHRGDKITLGNCDYYMN